MRASKWFVLSSALSILFGCAMTPTVPVITHEVASNAITSDPSRATIVVIQPKNLQYDYPPDGPTSIVDEEGRLVGQVRGGAKTVILVPPGAIRLYALSELFVDRLEGEVWSGKLYYATVGNRFHGMTFLALNPRSLDNRWKNLESYLSRTTTVEMDAAKIAIAVSSLGDTSSRLESMDEQWDKFDDQHIAERTIHPEDGL